MTNDKARETAAIKMAKYHVCFVWPSGMNIIDSDPARGTTINNNIAALSKSFMNHRL
jgi:hypothetical protein